MGAFVLHAVMIEKPDLKVCVNPLFVVAVEDSTTHTCGEKYCPGCSCRVTLRGGPEYHVRESFEQVTKVFECWLGDGTGSGKPESQYYMEIKDPEK